MATPSTTVTSTRTKALTDYRKIDGTDNNLLIDDYDQYTGADERRMTEAYYADGTSNGMITGPNPRDISNLLSGGDRAEVEDSVSGISGYSYVFGQFVDHDMDRTNSGGADISFTGSDGMTVNMTRFQMSAGGSAVNSVTGWLDLSQVYGSDSATAANLRLADGHMKTSAGNNLPIDSNGNFFAGDIRVMENPQLSAITTLFVREHNFQVDRLHKANPTWTGDQLYDMAKAITTGEYSNIVYNEFVPAIIGNAMPAYSGYNPNTNPGIMQEFAHAAYRFGHSIVSDEQEKLADNGTLLENQSLADAMQNSVAARLANGGMDALLRGPASDGANMVDTGAVEGLRNTPTGPGSVFDLIAIDIQRQFDLGLDTFNNTREAFGLSRIGSFEELTSDASLAADLHTLYDPYGGIDALDLFMGGLAEDHAPGSTMGETFTTIIATQFANLRDGDRYYWQNQSFDSATKSMISNTTLSSLIERDTDTTNMQEQAFVETTRHSSDVAPEDPNLPQLVIGINLDDAAINGGPNNDTLVLGNGCCQTMTGGDGSDLFIINNTGHEATITDFNTTFDQIQFHGNSPGNVPVVANVVGGGTELVYNQNKIELAGVNPTQLSQNNFTFTDGNSLVTNHSLVVG